MKTLTEGGRGERERMRIKHKLIERKVYYLSPFQSSYRVGDKFDIRNRPAKKNIEEFCTYEFSYIVEKHRLDASKSNGSKPYSKLSKRKGWSVN